MERTNRNYARLVAKNSLILIPWSFLARSMSRPGIMRVVYHFRLASVWIIFVIECIVQSMRKVFWTCSNFSSLKKSSSLKDHVTTSEQLIRELILLDYYWSFRWKNTGRPWPFYRLFPYWTIHSLAWRNRYSVDAFFIRPVFLKNITSDYFI